MSVGIQSFIITYLLFIFLFSYYFTFLLFYFLDRKRGIPIPPDWKSREHPRTLVVMNRRSLLASVPWGHSGGSMDQLVLGELIISKVMDRTSDRRSIC